MIIHKEGFLLSHGSGFRVNKVVDLLPQGHGSSGRVNKVVDYYHKHNTSIDGSFSSSVEGFQTHTHGQGFHTSVH